MNPLRRVFWPLGLLLWIGASGMSCADAVQQHREGPVGPDRQGQPPQNAVPGDYIVTVSNKECLLAVRSRLQTYGIRKEATLGPLVVLFSVRTDPGYAVVQKLLTAEPCVQAIQPNFRYQAL